MNDTVIAIDLAKTVFELAVSRHVGRVDERHRFNRSQLNAFLGSEPPAVIVMEACGSAHHWAREFQKLGHVVVLLPPHLVRPYVGRNKTDRTDAKGLLEAYRNKDISPVPVKTEEQQMLAALHRVRSGWVKDRTAKLNQLRGLCREIGITIPRGADRVVPAVRELAGDAERELARSFRLMLSIACDDIVQIEEHLAVVDHELKALARQLPAIEAWLTVPESASPRRPRCSPSWETSGVSQLHGTSPASWGSPLANARVDYDVASAPSRSAATPTCAPCSFTVRAPFSAQHRDRFGPVIGSAPGPWISRRGWVATRPLPLSPTSLPVWPCRTTAKLTPKRQ